MPAKIYQQPINWLQRIALYVTTSRYYLVGSNNTQTAFKVLKIDRTSNELDIVDDGVEYNYEEIRDLLMRIDMGNTTSKHSKGVEKTVSSFGLIGFVKFLHGYYLILIIKRRRVAFIGYHTIFKVEETKLVYIPNKPVTKFQTEEARYVKAFNNMDLTSNFYFSYSYDLTHTLQFNLIPLRVHRFRQHRFSTDPLEPSTSSKQQQQQQTKESNHLLVRSKPCYRFAWNAHLIDVSGLHDDWKIYLIHGFVEQANISVYSRSIYITLIARRSRLYSGTRFLKRGLNIDGNVANEVETEQIVHDSSISSFKNGYFTSFVQMRGSLPDRWSQNSTKIVPKPQINRDIVDPYHQAPSRHFDDLLMRYGSPVVVLNLVKRKEKKPHECILDTMLKESVTYLNQFLPPQHIIRHIAFDMARCNKSSDDNVMQRLGKIGFNILRVTGIFQSWRKTRRSNYDNTYNLLLRQRTFNRMPSSSRIGGFRLATGQCLQNGIVRVNCVDSLDRTNTAQFVLGKVALAFQLQAIGVLLEPTLEYETDAVRLLEQLYEDHGDTIALQYGGSQLVHRVKTYRKVAPLTSYSSEIMQTLSRYYSNTFSDAEKQNMINIFLGVRKPNVTDPWNFVTDYYLHNESLLRPFYIDDSRRLYTQWYNESLLKCLPRALNQYDKESDCYIIKLSPYLATINERIDYFRDAYKPYEVTYLSTIFHFQMLNTIRDFMPHQSTDYSPFCLRSRPGRLKEKYLCLVSSNGSHLPPNPSVSSLPPADASSDNSDLSIISDSEDSETGSDTDNGIISRATLSKSNTSYTSYTRMRRPSIKNSSRLQLSNSNITVNESDYCMISSALTTSDLTIYKKYVTMDMGCREVDLFDGYSYGEKFTESSQLLKKFDENFHFNALSLADMNTFQNYCFVRNET